MCIDNGIKLCFENLGIYYEESSSNFLIYDLIEDSIMFISLIVEIEEFFGIEIPDEFLIQERMQTYNDLKLTVESILKN